MTKEYVMKFSVTVLIVSDKEPETNPIRDAILEGLYIAGREGHLTALESEDEVTSFCVSHTSTVAAATA